MGEESRVYKKSTEILNAELDQSKLMRTAFLRICLVNHISKDNEELGVKKGDTVTYTVDEIKKKLDEWRLTKKFDYYLIVHDDIDNTHVHIVLVFNKNSSCEFSTLKKKFPWGQITTCKKVRSCVRYLTHADYPDKKQYDWSDVITTNPDKLEEYKAEESRPIIDVETDAVVDKILSGEIKPYEIYKIPRKIYLQKHTTIQRAFELREKLLVIDHDRNIEVYVFQGSPRVGKTTFSKILAKKSGKSHSFSSSSRDPWQDYGGQDIFIFDDFDHSKIDIEDFKKTLDPYTNTTMSRRYRNILFTGDTIIICTNTPITDWFPYSDDKSREAVFKRIKYVLDFKQHSELSTSTIPTIFEDFNLPEYSEGTSYYTVNTLVPTENFEKAYDKYGLVANRYRVWDLESVDKKLHEFNLKKYVDTTDGEKKRTDFRKMIEDI